MHGGVESIGATSPLEAELSSGRLRWFPEMGVGFYPVIGGGEVYNQAYFDRYAAYEQTPMGIALGKFRRSVVDKWVGKQRVLDIGIGSGAFVKSRKHTVGYDVNPVAVEWLRSEGLFHHPFERNVAHACMWDVLEHIEDFRPILRCIDRGLFVSIPIFSGCDHVLKSKHFRPDEHYWYFTDHGFRYVMAQNGFRVAEELHGETDLGRESIVTYVLIRS